MEEEKRDGGERDPIKMFLKESLVRYKNKMMDIFSQILQWLPTTMEAPSIRCHFRDATPFKVKVNFDIPLFQG